NTMPVLHTNTPTSNISLHDALPNSDPSAFFDSLGMGIKCRRWHAQILLFVLPVHFLDKFLPKRIKEFGTVHLPVSQLQISLIKIDRKSTRLNSSHVKISLAVFCFIK